MRRLLGLFCIAAAGCTGLVGEPDDGGLPVEVDSGVVDAGDVDAGEPPDAGDDAGVDAGPEDAGIDAGPVDAGPVIGLDSRPVNTTCIAPAPPPNTSGVTTQRVFPALAFNQPLGLFNPPGDPSRVWVQERPGFIRSFPNQNDAGVGSLTTVLDFDARVNDVGEGGFLGMAFHPQWPTVREVFISYTETASPLRTVISRFKSLDSGATLSLASEEKIFTIDQPEPNHNGGSISFGPDGFLYIGLGDGGGGGDPLNAGQRLNTNLGKFLRIDVNVPFAQRYAIPPSNPYAADNTPCNRTSSATLAATGVRCAEIYASGVRNPWRWSFDTASGELWCADVGQNAWEEIDRIVLGGNYGWRSREGAHCYNPATNCPTAGLIDPVVEYPRNSTGMSGNSVTGGFVYRGSTIPTLVGKFVFGDFGSGKIGVVQPDGLGGFTADLLADTNISLASFGQLADGEIYALDIGTGQVHKLVPSGTAPVDTFPRLLSQTGCFDTTDPKLPVAALVPYDVNAALWSDGASKQRFFAIPDGTTITVQPSGDFDFPNGTVLAKTFSLGGKRIETRLFMRHLNGTWAGYSYEWNDLETEATLLPGSKSRVVGAQTWSYPSRGQCLQCHTAIAGRSLGLELGQLNGDLLYPSTGRTANQLFTLETLGFFSAPLTGLSPRLDPPFGTGPLEARARAYLHANCAGCHQQGAGQGTADWRYSLSFRDTNSCNVAPQNGNLGITGAMVIAPGSPSTSIVSRRIHALTAARMPPVGSSLEDPQGTALIDQWITSLTACPP
ncbi:MAG: PQQ-dependent sugar dehydrogenase [Archangium sp.]|nr:PQQ-dependent sugar dehydrogenase [Archangium sp.]